MLPSGRQLALLPTRGTLWRRCFRRGSPARSWRWGTGKTRTSIELAKIRAHRIDRVVWCCPVSLKETIRQEILRHTDCRDVYR